MDILKSLNWNDSDEIIILEEYGMFIIEKAGHIPNAETLKTIEDMEEAIKKLHLLKNYSSFSEVIEELEKNIILKETLIYNKYEWNVSNVSNCYKYRNILDDFSKIS